MFQNVPCANHIRKYYILNLNTYITFFEIVQEVTVEAKPTIDDVPQKCVVLSTVFNNL